MLVRMGSACHILGVRKEIREKIGKTIGDEIAIVIEEIIEPGEITIPLDLSKALESDPDATAFFRKLSYSYQNEYIQWIEEAKREQTRQNRITKTIQLLKQGKKEH